MSLGDQTFDELVAAYGERKANEIMEERAAVARFRDAIETIRKDARWYWRWADGEGGFVLDALREAIVSQGYGWPYDFKEPRGNRKDKISRSLSKKVMERDGYRCVTCQTHIDLCCDHIVPESKGGPTAFENLQTMCRPCNSRKGNRT